MHIRTALLMAASVLLSSTVSASFTLESSLSNHHFDLEQVAQPINFWTNLRSFSWGLFLGVPGNQMHDKVKNCYNNIGYTITAVNQAYTNQQLYPDRTAEQLTTDIYNMFMKGVGAGQACADWGNHIIFKINEFRDLLNFFINSEGSINNANFYDAGLQLGFAISRMLA